MYSAESRSRWLQHAEDARPTLQHRSHRPTQMVEGRRNPAVYQGWEMARAGSVENLHESRWQTGQSFTLDFGCHLVGHLQFNLSADEIVDSPIRLQLVCGEVAAEVCEPFDPYLGILSRSWLQDETVNIDVVPRQVLLPRRYAFRYVKVTVVAASRQVGVRFDDLICRSVSAVRGDAAAAPPASLPNDIRALDAISLRTLANCMQTVFEDGPKRDRRLWIGDLRLQALVNEVSFLHFDLVQRCLYLFAALAREDGAVPACVYELPQPHRGDNYILDYEALFISTVLEYATASSDWETARELWPVVWRQVERLEAYVDAEGVFHDPGDYWLFIDWRAGLDKQTPLQGVIIYALRAAATLANAIGENEKAARAHATIQRMTQAAVRHLFCDGKRLFISGPERQVSWASQVWMVLAEVVDLDHGKRLLQTLLADSEAMLPAGPYLYHYALEAMFKVGMTAEAVALARRYWGDMVQKGATTFWEVHDPADETFSPYGSHLINSYCHAWSCTPAYFIRRYPEAFGAR